MTVFIAQGRMRWPLRCRAQELADCGWNVREPRDKGHQTTARPGGRSKCMSGRQSVRTRRRVGESDNSWGHAASRKVHPRAERRAQYLLLWPSCGSLAIWARRIVCSARTHTPCTAKVHGCHVFARGAAGAVKRSSVPHAPSGEMRDKKTGLSRAGQRTEAMTRDYTPPSCPRRRASSIPERQRFNIERSGILGPRLRGDDV